MMTSITVPFESDLRRYLERIDTEAREPVRMRRIDPNALHEHLLRRLRDHEKGTDPEFQSETELKIKKLHAEWPPGRLQAFASFLELLPESVAPIDSDNAQAFAQQTLDVATYGDWRIKSVVVRLELARLVTQFEITEYAVENRLLRVDSDSRRLTEVGRIFLRLRGRDAVRWLLTVEVAQTTGRRDPWHTSRELLQEALSFVVPDQAEDNEHFEFASSARRLAELGVITSVERSLGGRFYKRFTVDDESKALVQDVLEFGPWHTAVTALLDDERSLAFHAPGPSSSDATIEQTKLITHEVRNALVPVRHHLDAIRASNPETPLLERATKARNGVVRVLDFVEQLVATSELITEPFITCGIADVIHEAVSWVDGDERVEVSVQPGLVVKAPRTRLVRAIANVIRNALQATPMGKPVRISQQAGTGTAIVVVDDAGPGVPAPLVDKVFDDGFTTREGGTGFGLAFARNVVETTLRGTISCEHSELGGARFVITLPQEKS